MEEKRKIPVVTLVLFVLAIALLLFSGIGGARAALNYVSQSYSTRLRMQEMGIHLLENGSDVSDGTLLNQVEEEIQLGKAYPEALSVENTGEMDAYVRIIVWKYWTQNSKKQTTLTPDLIDLGQPGSGWVEDTAASTQERSVYYYTKPLAAGEQTAPLFTTLTLKPDVAACVTLTGDGTATTYDYNGAGFALKAEADAVQTHSAEDAILSAWGVGVHVDGSGNLTLAQ